MGKSTVKFKTKMNIFFIVLKVLLCITIMVSSTYALFTDSDGASVCVTAGEMDVNLLQWTPDGYKDISERQGDVFGTGLWEPGYTRVVFLKVENRSNVPVKYMLNMNVVINELSGAFEYCVFESDAFDTGSYDWESLSQMGDVSELNGGVNDISDMKNGNYIYLEEGGEVYYTLAVHMLPDDGNVYQNKTAAINIHLFAVQGNVSDEMLASDTASETAD
ncbi:MAG: hypothetical protein IJ011_09020 [Clostridia bacterium]|nr:hypothetical protein [Clostridia bacterium]